MDMKMQENSDRFLQLYETEWHNRVAAPALNNLAVKKHNVPQLLPSTTDLLKLRKYLTEKLASLTEKVNEKVNKKDWRELAELCLARLIMFNKRRGNLKSSLMSMLIFMIINFRLILDNYWVMFFH
jgi:cobalamin biosynthesis protein CobT